MCAQRFHLSVPLLCAPLRPPHAGPLSLSFVDSDSPFQTLQHNHCPTGGAQACLHAVSATLRQRTASATTPTLRRFPPAYRPAPPSPPRLYSPPKKDIMLFFFLFVS